MCNFDRIKILKIFIASIISVIYKYYEDTEYQEQARHLRMLEIKEEHENKDTSKHVLDLFEIMDMDVIGCASWIKREDNQVEYLEKKIELLKRYSLLEQPRLLDWLHNNNDTYPKLVSYYLILDHLRQVVLELFQIYRAAE